MAKETKLLFSLSDISSIRFTCNANGCGAVQSFPVKTWTQMPRYCSNDHTHDWLKQGSLEDETLTQFREALQVLLKYNGTSTFKLQLEFDTQADD